MRATRLISFVSILLLFSCVDPLFYDIDLPQGLPIVVYGHISNQPGPYQVNINSSFDTKSEANLRVPVSAQHVNLMDELGGNEELSEVTPGVYQTSPTGIQGRIGGVYKLRIELLDGRIYESISDTLLPPGTIDTLYHEFNSKQDFSGQTHYGFDLMINARGNVEHGTRYMWNFVGTFMAITHPELINIRRSQCYPREDEHYKCNFLPLCTGLRNTAPVNVVPAYPFNFNRVAPCTCCTCWYKIFNNSPILSDEIFNSGGIYRAMPIYKIPLNEWIFMFKIHTEVTQYTLTENSFRFFKSIENQKEALGSLFQPITGKVPNTFIQVEGVPAPINGIFYAAGVDNKSIFIFPDDVGKGVPIPIVRYDLGIGAKSCLELFPNAVNIKPDFWID